MGTDSAGWARYIYHDLEAMGVLAVPHWYLRSPPQCQQDKCHCGQASMVVRDEEGRRRMGIEMLYVFAFSTNRYKTGESGGYTGRR